ncbi:MAG TPA: hypothetical protein ENN39_00140 [Desulfonatronum sp.]|nr:hypothetical protein [Desulfonatronum sp.]
MTTVPTHVYDSSGKFLGVFIPSQFWDQLDKNVKQVLRTANPVPKPIKEPLDDWETLKQIWDFPYPVDTDVQCSLCGNMTDNWEGDEPRKFILKAANIGGLVSFECCRCHARIRKNHFKDAIEVACTPQST